MAKRTRFQLFEEVVYGKTYLPYTRSTSVSSHVKEKCEKHAEGMWNKFYKNNTSNFFKDRHYLWREFPELLLDKFMGVMEFGCGVGNSTYPLLEANGKLHFYAFDFSEVALAVLAGNAKFGEYSQRVHLFHWDPASSPSPSSPFRLDVFLKNNEISAKFRRKFIHSAGKGSDDILPDHDGDGDHEKNKLRGGNIKDEGNDGDKASNGEGVGDKQNCINEIKNNYLDDKKDEGENNNRDSENQRNDRNNDRGLHPPEDHPLPPSIPLPSPDDISLLTNDDALFLSSFHRHPLPPFQSCDYVLLIFVLSAISPDKMAAALKHIRPYMKEGGEILFRDYADGDLAQSRFLSKKSTLGPNYFLRSDGTFSYFFTPQYLSELCEESGFTAEGVEVVEKEVVNHKENKVMKRSFIQAKLRKTSQSL